MTPPDGQFYLPKYALPRHSSSHKNDAYLPHISDYTSLIRQTTESSVRKTRQMAGEGTASPVPRSPPPPNTHDHPSIHPYHVFYLFTCTSVAAQMLSALGATQFGLSVSSTCDNDKRQTTTRRFQRAFRRGINNGMETLKLQTNKNVDANE